MIRTQICTWTEYYNRSILEDVNTFKYLGATLKSNGSSDNELRIRLATAYFCNDKTACHID